MIFVTVGTQLPFDRLVQAVDGWAAMRPAVPVLAQVNGGVYVPRHLQAVPGLTPAQFALHFAAAQVVVAHAGMGTIISSLEVGKPLVLLPRLAARGEHRNDHQVGTARRFAGFSCIRVAAFEEDLGPLIDELLATGGDLGQAQGAPDVSAALLEGIRRFLAGQPV
jgi:UDP-N-acetylglucosamine transferase subunit ALG13